MRPSAPFLASAMALSAVMTARAFVLPLRNSITTGSPRAVARSTLTRHNAVHMVSQDELKKQVRGQRNG